MREEKTTADRLAAFSDAVFAVIVTVMVLELRAPEQPAFSALWPLWPTAISYAVSYLFIATPMRTPRRCPRVCGVWRRADRSLSLRASRPLCWLRSSRRASASVSYAPP